MIKNRKGVTIPVEGLVRIIIMISLVIIVFSIGKEIGKYVLKYFFGTDLEGNFNNFADDLNKLSAMESQSRQVFITLDQNTAIIGFSRHSDAFRCFACGSGTNTDITSFFNKPDAQECKDKPCVCLCPTPLQIDLSKSPYEMKCDKIKCKSLNENLAETINLKQYIQELGKEWQQQFSFLSNAKWTGGFLFERQSRGDFISNGLPQKPGSRFTVYVNKERVENNNYIIVCPGAECESSFKQQQGIPSNICQIMYSCFDSEKVNRIPKFPDSYCRYDRPRTRQLDKADCEKVKSCLIGKAALTAKCEPIDPDPDSMYELSVS